MTLDARLCVGSMGPLRTRCMRLNKRLVWPLEDRWNAFKVQQLPVGISMGCRSLLAATALLAE